MGLAAIGLEIMSFEILEDRRCLDELPESVLSSLSENLSREHFALTL